MSASALQINVLKIFVPIFENSFFLYSDLIRTVFSPNTRKYGPEKTLHLDTFHAVHDFKNKYFLYSSHHEKYAINLSFKRLLETFSNIPLNLQIYL